MKKWLLSNIADTHNDKTKNTAFAFLIMFLYILVVNFFLKGLYTAQFTENTSWILFFSCIVAPLWEELVFRVAPIRIARNLGEEYIVPIIIISSAIFGWEHGYGAVSLLKQGMMGMVFSILYIKNGFNYWYNVALHSAWNLLCFVMY